MRDALLSGGSAALTQAISGLGGIGKTALAVEYAYVFANHYDFRLFARADSTTTLIASYREIAQQLGLPEAASEDVAVLVQGVKHYLNTAVPSAPGKMPFLLILDNADFVDARIADQVPLSNAVRMITVEELTGFLPEDSKGHILLTTRADSLDGQLNIPVDSMRSLDVLDPAEAERFLKERVYGKNAVPSPEETTAIAELAKTLGYLPLALEQSAAYVAANRKMRTFQNYLAVYRAQEAKDAHIPEQLERAKPQTGKYEKTVATTWKISFDAVEVMEPASADLMSLCAFVGSDAIPAELVIAVASIGAVESIQAFFGRLDDAAVNEQRFTELLEPLLKYSLVLPGGAPATFTIHRLVQAVVRGQMNTKEQKSWTTVAVEALYKAFPSADFDNWAICGRLISHVQTIFLFIRAGYYRSEVSAHLLNRSAFYFFGRGFYVETEPLLVTVRTTLAWGIILLPLTGLQLTDRLLKRT